MRLWEILCPESDATGLIKSVAPSKSRPDAYQNGASKKRPRYQGGGNSRWQTPPEPREAKATVGTMERTMKKMRMVAPILAMMLASSAFAEPTSVSAFTYLRAKDDPNDKAASVAVDTYLTGVSEALTYLNVNLKEQNKPLLYCIKTEMTVEILKETINKFFVVDSFFPETAMTDDFKKVLPIALIVVQRLPKEFPCQ
ncbi:hypothetical protein [Methylorubrum extorquens]|nr:hypothetical protein [Methylorubrum extorquens]